MDVYNYFNIYEICTRSLHAALRALVGMTEEQRLVGDDSPGTRNGNALGRGDRRATLGPG